jgi:hypothetical protein
MAVRNDSFMQNIAVFMRYLSSDPIPAPKTDVLLPFFPMQDFVNPKPFLQELAGKPVIVKLKWGTEYKGSDL